MRNVILAAGILQLAIILTESNGQFQFGDIISFKRSRGCTTFTYKHYAIFVGNGTIDNFPDKTAEQDIFHRTGPNGNVSDCGFGILQEQEEEQRKGERDNYLDQTAGFQDDVNATNHRDMVISRILAFGTCCPSYNLFKENCEHLAVYVRYGVKVSKQKGTLAALFSWGRVKKYPALDAAAKRINQNAINQEKYNSCSNNRTNTG